MCRNSEYRSIKQRTFDGIVFKMRLLFRLPRSRRGIALVMVLWVLTLLALIAASFSSTTRTELNLARNLVESAKAEALAEAGVNQAVLGLLGESGDQPWRVDGTVYAWRFGGGQIRVAIADEGGKIDLNVAQAQILRNLFLALEFKDGSRLELGEADALSDAIADFRDEDDLTHPSGAEDADYEAAGLEHDAKDARFETLEELQQVYGMTAKVYELVAPALTVHTRRRRPFPATAPPLVQAALAGGLGDATAREASPGLAAELEAEVVEVEEITGIPQIIELGPTPARSRVPVYTVHAEGLSAGRAVYALEAILRITRGDEQPYIVLAWTRAQRRLFVGQPEDELILEE